MKKLLIIPILFLSQLLFAQNQVVKSIQWSPTLIVSTLPSASTNKSRVFIITNGINSSDCTVGGGTFKVFCFSNGTTYEAVGGSALRSIGMGFGDAATGSALTTAEVGYVTVPYACTIVGWHMMVDAGTATIKVWRVNGGTALPTVANSINTNGVSISSGTKIDSTTVSDFTSTSIAANDTLGISIFAVSTAKQLTFQLDCR